MSIIPYVDELVPSGGGGGGSGGSGSGSGGPVDPPVLPPLTPDDLVTNELYQALTPFHYSEADTSQALLRFCKALCLANDKIAGYARDVDGLPGWSVIMDIERAPLEALPWLGQMVGVRPGLRVAGETDDQYTARLRDRIANEEGFDRGSVSALVGAAQQYLTGTKSVLLNERDSSAYHFTVHTFTDETPDPGLVLAALQSQKPAGLIMVYSAVGRNSYATLDSTYATYSAFDAHFNTYAQVETG